MEWIDKFTSDGVQRSKYGGVVPTMIGYRSRNIVTYHTPVMPVTGPYYSRLQT
jgi:hypothetical protein